MKRVSDAFIFVAVLSLAFFSFSAQTVVGSDLPSALIDAHVQQESLLPAVSAEIQTQINDAKQLFNAEQFTNAADKYKSVASAVSQDLIRVRWANMEAGVCYEHAGQSSKAIEAYDAVVAAGPHVREWWGEEALYRKAVLCEQAGQNERAIAAAEYLRIGFPYTVLRNFAIELKGRMKGTSAAQVDEQKTREAAAARMLRGGTKIRAQRESDPKKALQDCEQIITTYPETAAAIHALKLKAHALSKQGYRGQAFDTKGQIIDQAMTLAPRSVIVQEAACGRAHKLLGRSENMIALMYHGDEAKKSMAYDKLRAGCNQIIFMEPILETKNKERHIARAHLLLAKAEKAKGKYAESEQAIEQLLSTDYAGSQWLEKIPEQILQMKLFVATQARIQQNYEKSLQINESLRQTIAQLPTEVQDKEWIQHALQRSYYQTFLTLLFQRADLATIKAAGQDVLNHSPADSLFSIDVRRRLGITSAE